MKRFAGLCAWGAFAAHAQEIPVPQEPIVVSATREDTRAFDAPAAVSVVDAATLRVAGPMVNLSEAMARVPGLTVLNRQNFSQDLQLSIRGFGARSTFGIRGVRLIVDGIPATMPDGQGQASAVSLPSAARIEVLRGPLALLYGNAAGGVVMVVTEAGAPQPTLSASASAGSFGAHRGGVSFAQSCGPYSFIVEASRFATDGYREHSAAERSQLNAKWSWAAGGATRVDVVFNHFDQPLALDPLGLTRAQWEENPRQAPAIAFAQDARKTVRQTQAGAVIEHRFDTDTTLRARVHAGRRDLDNALSVPPAAQAPPTSSGGIVSFERDYSGVGLQLSRRFALPNQMALRLVAGVEMDRMREDRQGYVNIAGERGALKRDEDNTVVNRDALLQAVLQLGERWEAIAGVRASRVRFDTHDRFIAPGNPDDSGDLAYRGTNPVGGITFHVDPRLNLYGNVGRGFETPTFTELAYRNAASGLNTGLAASTSRHAELGAKWRAAGHALDAAFYDIRTDDEIAVDTNAGGRSTFRNAGPTVRRGFELSHGARWLPEWRTSVALTVLRARFDSAFTSGSGAAAVPVARGNRLPGTPERSAFAELVYEPRAWRGFHAGLEVVHVGRLFVNDANEDFAPAATVVNVRVGTLWRMGALEVEPLVRLENASDRRYSGSVIVNEGNRRFFEPAPGRNWLVGISARYRF
ncbi:MAG TPA: TonB-dependent receptor [Usitatibacter sp.]|nr:TonB-dependent receptor [Usitatibacter sp.]